MIFVENIKKSKKNLQKKYPNAYICNLTSSADDEFIEFSPFYPHQNIPIPNTENNFSASVEGIWQGLKVFESQDIDTSKFRISNMKGLKRLSKYLGRQIGHRYGVNGEIIDYTSARKLIFLPTYRWVLENKLIKQVSLLKNKAIQMDIVFLDFETNCDINNTLKPLSHAYLVKEYLEQLCPSIKDTNDSSIFRTVNNTPDQLSFNFNNL